jgi:methionyl-tRNA formyltransferase
MNIIFFGSTTDSLIVAEKLLTHTIAAVVTQPPRPVGREHTITPTPVEIWAKKHALPLVSFSSDPTTPWQYENEQTVIDTLSPFRADLLVSASYGQKIPTDTIEAARYGGLNVHPSLLPRWRGADPVPWAILSGDHQIGVTVVTISDQFDEGKIIAQKKLPILDSDLSDPLRTKLFTIGADLLMDALTFTTKGTSQKESGTPYARKFTRQDGFEPWEKITDPNEAERINRKYRALHPWPGLWTLFQDKRLKILAFDTTPTLVQLEGKQPVSFAQFSQAYLLTATQ